MNPGLTKNYNAGGAISKRRFVRFGADDKTVVQAAAATDSIIGVSTDVDTVLGEPADVIHGGIALVEAGGVITRGQAVTSDANGKAVAATRHTHVENTAATYTQNAQTAAGSGERIAGFALASAVAGDLIPVLLQPSFA